MNIPALEMQAFLAHCGSLVFPGQRVLRSDHFCRTEDQKWATVFILEQNGSPVLANAEGRVLGRYERIQPLFVAEPTQSRQVQDLLDQLSELRNRFPREKYDAARSALERLSGPSGPFAPVYQVEQAGLLGIADPMGQIIVPVEYAQITPFALAHPGDAGLFLCHRGGHRLNDMDVFDWKGNCIFRQISNLYPREQIRRTAANTAETVEKVKSLWVVCQNVDRPFPEDPDFQLIQEDASAYTVKELRKPVFSSIQLSAMEDRPTWQYCPPEETPPGDTLASLAATVGTAMGCSAQQILSRLGDYRTFRQQMIPLSHRLAHVTADTPLNKLDFSVRAHHCLVRSGVQTAGDVAALTEQDLSGLRRSTHEILQEIRAVQKALAEFII